MNLSVITTFRASDQHRLENLYAVERQYYEFFPDCEMIIVEQSRESGLDRGRFSGDPDHIVVDNPGPFNKAWGLNVGYRVSRGQVLVMTDSDMLIERTDIERAILAAQKSIDLVRPFQKLIDLSEIQTQHYFQSGQLPGHPGPGEGYNRAYRGEQLCLAGGVFVTTRAFYERVGGFDERFCGWGGEDDAFSIKVQRMTNRSVVARHATAWHLWHPRANHLEDSTYHRNVTLLRQYQNSEGAEIRARCREMDHDLGRLNKFKK